MAQIESTSDIDFLAEALRIETEIFNASSQHELDTITSRWSILEKRFQLALKAEGISLLAKDRVHCVFERIRVFSRSFSDIMSKAAELNPNYIEALDNIHFTLDSPLFLPTLDSCPSKPYLRSLGRPKSSPILPPQNSVTAYHPAPLPEFIEHAYKYFVTNIHNPYPSREEKQAIVDMSSSSRVTLTSVSNWFTNARRRCGWAEILKSRCKGNREEMIDISKRIFVQGDLTRPVDAQIVAEFMEMKKNVETMYEKKTRTSAWIEDLDQLVSIISSEKHSEKNRQVKKKTQADKAPRRIQRDRESQNSLSRTASLSSFTSSGSTIEDDEFAFESKPVFDGKRKGSPKDSNFLHLRGSSPASSLSSFSFASEFTDSRVPSLSWSDSGDEERPRKRPRSYADTSVSSSPVLSELAFPLDDSLQFKPSSSTNSLFIPTRGQKRSYDASLDIDATPTAKRIRSDFTQTTQDTNIASPNAGPVSDFMSSSTVTSHRRSSFSLVDFDSLLTLGTEEPQPVEIAPPDTSVPLEVGVFDWSNPLDSFDFIGGPGMNVDSAINSEIVSTDFSQLFHLFTGAGVEPEITAALSDKTDVGAGIESPLSDSPLLAAQLPYASEESLSLSLPDIQVDLSSFDLTCLFPENDPQSSPPDTRDLTVDPSTLTSDPISVQTFDGYSIQAAVPMQNSATHPNAPIEAQFETSQPRSVTPTWTSTSVPATPETQDVLPTTVPSVSAGSDASIIDLTGQDLTLVEKALRKEYKRRELAEKKAALERELEELERE